MRANCLSDPRMKGCNAFAMLGGLTSTLAIASILLTVS